MQRVKVEAAMGNAQMLIEVLYDPLFHSSNPPLLIAVTCVESQHKLLRQMRPLALNVPLKERIAVPDSLHGEVHVCVECG